MSKEEAVYGVGLEVELRRALIGSSPQARSATVREGNVRLLGPRGLCKQSGEAGPWSRGDCTEDLDLNHAQHQCSKAPSNCSNHGGCANSQTKRIARTAGIEQRTQTPSTRSTSATKHRPTARPTRVVHTVRRHGESARPPSRVRL